MEFYLSKYGHIVLTRDFYSVGYFFPAISSSCTPVAQKYKYMAMPRSQWPVVLQFEVGEYSSATCAMSNISQMIAHDCMIADLGSIQDSILNLRTNRILKMPDPCMRLDLPINLVLLLIKYLLFLKPARKWHPVQLCCNILKVRHRVLVCRSQMSSQ